MAMYSVRVSAHSRSKGESAVGGAAYRLGIAMTNEQTGERHNYSRRDDVVSAFTLLPDKAPEGWEDPAILWNEAEKSEKRINSVVSRELLVALPAEMTPEQREDLTRSIATQVVVKHGLAVSVGIHQPDDGGSNFHAHILMSSRRVGPDGFGEKPREFNGKEGKETITDLREMVAQQTNEALQRHGYSDRVDHRTLKDQRQDALDNGDIERAAKLSRAPTRHQGRAPELSACIAVANEATAKANEQSQAEARAMFDRMEAEASSQARLMVAASDGQQAKQAQQQEQDQEEKAARDFRAAERDLIATKQIPEPKAEAWKTAHKQAQTAAETLQACGDRMEGWKAQSEEWQRKKMEAEQGRGVLWRWFDIETPAMKEADKSMAKLEAKRAAYLDDGSKPGHKRGAWLEAMEKAKEAGELLANTKAEAQPEIEAKKAAIDKAQEALKVARDHQITQRLSRMFDGVDEMAGARSLEERMEAEWLADRLADRRGLSQSATEPQRKRDRGRGFSL